MNQIFTTAWFKSLVPVESLITALLPLQGERPGGKTDDVQEKNVCKRVPFRQGLKIPGEKGGIYETVSSIPEAYRAARRAALEEDFGELYTAHAAIR